MPQFSEPSKPSGNNGYSGSGQVVKTGPCQAIGALLDDLEISKAEDRVALFDVLEVQSVQSLLGH